MLQVQNGWDEPGPRPNGRWFLRRLLATALGMGAVILMTPPDAAWAQSPPPAADLASVVGELDKVLALDPQSIPAREERAVALARLGQIDRARSDLGVLRTRALVCGRACPPDLRKAISRVEAALIAARRPAGRSDGYTSQPVGRRLKTSL